MKRVIFETHSLSDIRTLTILRLGQKEAELGQHLEYMLYSLGLIFGKKKSSGGAPMKIVDSNSVKDFYAQFKDIDLSKVGDVIQ